MSYARAMGWLALVLAFEVACGSDNPVPSSDSVATDGSSSTTNRTPYEAFRTYAAKKLGVAPDKLNGGGPVDPGTASKMPQTVGRLWPYAFNTSVSGYREANGWATADGTVVSADENLGRLFDKARMWAWSFGAGNRVIGGESPADKLPGPSLERQRDGSGQLVFTTTSSAGGAELVTTNTVTLRPNHSTTLSRVPRK
jgi:hypothetical protein